MGVEKDKISSCVYLNQKPHPNVFFVKSHDWNYSYGIEMIQSTHIQYTLIKYFIKFCNYLNFLKVYLHLQYIGIGINLYIYIISINNNNLF